MREQFSLFPESASTFAGQVDALYLFLVAMSAFFTVAIAVVVIYCAVRYRRRHPDEIGHGINEHLMLEIIWTIIPLGIVLFIFFWGAHVFFVQRRPPVNAVEYTAIGRQWMWKFQHPEGQREINELHIPVGQAVKMKMISQDVIHSLYFPAFRTKQDVLPGRYTTLWFEPTKTGTFHIFCTEYCGADHSTMIGRVIVQTAEEYERWLSGGVGESLPPAEVGAALFASIGCGTCHGSGGGGRGPDLENLYGHEVELVTGETAIVDDSYLRESILNPGAKVVAGYQPVMTTYKGQVSEENVFNLIAYIKSLTDQPNETAAPAEPTTEQETTE